MPSHKHKSHTIFTALLNVPDTSILIYYLTFRAILVLLEAEDIDTQRG